MMKYRLAIENIEIFRGGERREYVLGDPLDDVHPANLEPMIRLRQAVPASEYFAPPADNGEAEPLRDWKETPTSDLDLHDVTRAALVKAKLHTVAQVLAYGAKNETLTTLKGIGDSGERAIQQAIDKIRR